MNWTGAKPAEKEGIVGTKSERKPKNTLREALARTRLPANGSSQGCDVSTTGAQSQQPLDPMTTISSRLQLALLKRRKGRNLLEKGFTLVELMVVVAESSRPRGNKALSAFCQRKNMSLLLKLLFRLIP